MARIPFNRPVLVGQETEYILDAIRRAHISGDGHYTRLCHAWLERRLGVPKALLSTSCTHALEMSALLLDIQPGDEVIIPSFGFVSIANAFVLRGARPVFSDIRPDTLNLDESGLEALITERTRAIAMIHYAGVGCEMDAIQEIATRHSIALVEDNAHGLFGKYKGRPLGTFGAFATLSFHETKNVSCGEGGALLINQSAYVDRAEVLREKGTNRSRLFRGQVEKYTWIDVGSSYLPSDILAAFLFAQLEASQRIQEHRRRVWHFYFDHLREWALDHDVRLPEVPAHCEQPFHMFYILLPCREDRQALIEHLKIRDISSVFHYLPLHLSSMGLKFGGGNCPVTEDVSDRLLRLPFYNDIDECEQAEVIEAIKAFRGWTARPLGFSDASR